MIKTNKIVSATAIRLLKELGDIDPNVPFEMPRMVIEKPEPIDEKKIKPSE